MFTGVCSKMAEYQTRPGVRDAACIRHCVCYRCLCHASPLKSLPILRWCVKCEQLQLWNERNRF